MLFFQAVRAIFLHLNSGRIAHYSCYCSISGLLVFAFSSWCPMPLNILKNKVQTERGLNTVGPKKRQSYTILAYHRPEIRLGVGRLFVFLHVVLLFNFTIFGQLAIFFSCVW